MNNKNLKHIDEYLLFLFDMDGTLVNTEPLHAKAMNKVFHKYNISIDITNAEALERFKGMTDLTVLNTLCPNLSETDYKNMIIEKNIVLKNIFLNLNNEEKKSLTSPGIRSFISHLKKNNKKLAVVSASENEIVNDTLCAFDLIDEFDFWLGRHSTEKTKPSPDPYLLAMKMAEIGKENTIIFEDSPTGLKSAKTSGARVIEVAPFSSENYLKDFSVLITKN